jgi:hypothetical protein
MILPTSPLIMNFFKKIFRSKKRSKTNPDLRLPDSYNKETGYSKNGYHGDNRMSRDDSFLPSRYLGENTKRPLSAPPSRRGYSTDSQYHNRTGPPAVFRMPDNILNRIFSYVCPHATDHSFLTAEETTTEAGCMLCDMRDLAYCGLVCKRWHKVAEPLLYTSIRLDSVHYCGMEEELEARRKRGSVFQKKYEPPMEVPETRMRLLYRTFQENERIAFLVQFFKVPYMTRETCIADHARLVSLTPELRYCDVADGVFSDDASCAGLKAILYARCPELRKMTWTTGSEKNFVDLWVQPPWRNLEVVNLTSLRVENADIVRMLNSLPTLHDLTLKALPWITDPIFDPTPNPTGVFPALSTLALEDVTTISFSGLKMYLSRPMISASLTKLSLSHSSILPQQLPHLLAAAVSLESLSFLTTVTRALPTPEPPLLKSKTLKMLRYEIINDSSSKSLAEPTPSYYSYLASSLLSGSLSALTSLYVREPEFAERLEGHSSALTHQLTIHTKSADHLDWVKFLILPPSRATIGGRGQLEVKAVWEMPRNSLVADFSDPRMSGFLKAAAAEWGDDMLVPPSPGFCRDSTGSRPSTRGSDTGVNVNGGGPVWMEGHRKSSSRGSLTLPSPAFAKKERRGSRQDLWR